MAGGLPGGSTDREMQCPACRAVQPWSDACRRCKCDLGLLRSAVAAANERRTQCLEALRDGRWPEAVHLAQQAYDLAPTQDAARTLAVCHLVNGEWRLALELARRAAD